MSNVLDGLDNIEVEGGTMNNNFVNNQVKSPSLPSIPKHGSGSKFSSWNGQNNGSVQNSVPKSGDKDNHHQADFMDEVDELLLEQELLSPTAASAALSKISSKTKISHSQSRDNKENMKDLDNTKKADINGKASSSPEIKQDSNSKNKNTIDKLRDSTLEKLLNGEKDLRDLDIEGIEEMSPADKQTLRKKLSNSLYNKKKDQNGNEVDEFIMQDISDDLNQLLENYDDIMQQSQSKGSKTNQKNGNINKRNGEILKKGQDGNDFRSQSAKVDQNKDIKQHLQFQEEDSWALSPLKNQKLNSNSQLNNKNNNREFVETNQDDIDSLVEEELSRNDNQSGDENDNEDNRAIGVDGRSLKSNSTTDSKSIDGKNITDNKRSISLSGNYNSVPIKKGMFGASQQRRSSIEQHENGEDKIIEDHINTSGGQESQMFKELFSQTNKSKGIAGIHNVKITSKGSGEINDDDIADEVDDMINGGPKLVSDKKNEELQVLASMQLVDESTRQLSKTRSKKDLKNKFKSSSAIYNNGIKMEPENELETRQDIDARNISDIISRHIQKEEQEKLGKEGGKYPIPAGIPTQGLMGIGGIDALKMGNKNQQIDDSEIDEIIKQHLIEEEQNVKDQLKIKKKKSKGKNKKKTIEDGEEKRDVGVGSQPDDEDDLEENTNSGDEYDDDDMDGNEEEIDDETEPKKKSLGDDDDPYDFLDDSLNMNVKSPKLTLIEHLRLLADIFNSSLDEASEYYDQIFDERAQFMLDFENILKIMTFDETVEFVLPCMQIYSSEQDYLKLKLFQNLEKLFKKLFKAEVFIPKSEIIDIITINIFPLASRMLMLSEEPVQIEGVEALLNLSKQYIPKEQSQNLVMKVIQVIMDRISPLSEHQESEDVKEKAKIAILIIVQKFTDADIFKKEQCEYFLNNYLEDIQEGMLFKIKKFVMPALIAVAKHLEDNYIEKVYNETFKLYNNDDIWGVRKVCIENLANLIKYIKYDDITKIKECIEFFEKCLIDANRWVKNQALIQFGPIVHEIFLKIEKIPVSDKNKDAAMAALREQINLMCLSYYNMKMIFGDKDDLDSSLMDKLDDYSFMQNKADDVDKVKYYWAYNLPCALLVNEKSKFWFSHMKSIYDLLYKDVLINLRTTIAASFKDIIEILEIDKMEKQEERQYFVTVLNHFLKDSEEISAKVLPHICKLISKFPDEEKTDLLDSLIRTKIESIKTMKNGRDNMIKMLEQIFDMFAPAQLMESNFHEYLFDIITNERAINYKLRAAQVIGSKIISPLIKGKKYRALLTNFTDDLRVSKNFRDRQMYIQIASSAYESDTEIFKKHFAKNMAQDLEYEPCKCVQISLSKLCHTVKEGYSKSLDKVRVKLIADNDPTIVQYMPASSKDATKAELDRRFLAQNYGDEASNLDNIDKIMTEEEWLEKEKKEIQEVEKTVTIRFANYSTLMRAQTLTQGLSAQLAVFLRTMGVAGQNPYGQQPNILKASQILDNGQQIGGIPKAGINSDINKVIMDKAAEQQTQAETKKNSKLRSLSPLGMLDDEKDAKIDEIIENNLKDQKDSKDNNSLDNLPEI